MKNYLIAIAVVLTLSMNAEAAAQKHRHTPRTEQVDSTKNNQDAIEAFSDTTGVADGDSAYIVGYGQDVTLAEEDAKRAIKGALTEVFDELDGKDVAGGILITFIGLTILLLPFFILVAMIIYFVNRNRRDRIRLAQMAMQNGQPIPEQLFKEHQDEWDKNNYQSGIRQMFTGIGLAIFLGFAAGEVGFGIGALVFFIGLGKWVIARQSRNVGDKLNEQFNNNSNIQNYD